MDTTAPTIELQPAPTSAPFTRTHVEADTTETTNLTLRPLKKHTNVRLGKKIDLTGYPSKTSLFTISNKHSWFFAAHEHTIRASPLSELRTFLAQTNSQEEAQFLCQVKLDVSPELPLFIALAAEESKLVVASSSSVSIWDVGSVINGETTLAHTFKLNNVAIVDVLPNPGENPETVAILTTGHSQDEPYTLILYNCVAATEIVRWSGMMRNGNAPLAASWSSKGKQIAIALSSGDIVQYSPSSPAEAKATISRAQGPDLQGTVPLSLQWLSNTTFYVIYAQPRLEAVLDDYAPEQYNYIISYDKKTNHAIDTLVPLPWEPYGMQREPGHLVAGLRPWGVFKHLLFVTDAHANDVGIMACLGNAGSSPTDDSGRWVKVSLGEDSLTFPLSSDMDDTSLVGMSMDLSATQKLLASSQANGDDPSIPPAPILYMMTNDAVIVAFHIVNEDGSSYPFMATDSTSMDASSIRGGTEQGMDMSTDKSQVATPTAMESDRPTPTLTQAPSAFGSAGSAAPAFGQTGFGFGGASAPKFGSTGFGSASSPFATAAASSTNTTAFKPSGPTLGFGAFAAAKPSFGSSSFGTPSQSTFGQSSFGTPSSASSSTPAPSAFGSTAASPPAFGSNSGGGFAAFAGPKTAFGQSSFGIPSTQSAFGASNLGSASGTPATQSAFGFQASSSTPTAAMTPPSPPMGSNDIPKASPATQAPAPSAQTPSAAPVFKPSSGFGAFSGASGSSGSSTFGSFSNPKPVAFDGKATAFAPPAPVTTSPFGAPSTATAGTAGPKFGQSGFGQSTFGQSKFGQSGFGQSAFGVTKSAFAPPTSYAVSSTPASGGGFGAFAGTSTSFASLAGQAADKSKPAFAQPETSTDGKPATIAKDPAPIFGVPKQASSTETKKETTAFKSPFGSNTAVSKPGFGGPLRARTGNDDDEEEREKASDEKFPEEEADKLEPETVFTGPGLFEAVGSSKSKDQDKAVKGLGQLGFDSAKSQSSAGPSKVNSAFSTVPALNLSAQPKTPAKSQDGDASAELEDDVNEFLTDGDEDEEDLEEVDLTGDLEVHEFDDAEEVEEDEEEEDEDEEEEEDEDEDAVSLPDDASGDSTPPGSKRASSAQVPAKPAVPAAAAGAVYNPFGRPANRTAASTQPEAEKKTQDSQTVPHTPTKALPTSRTSTPTAPPDSRPQSLTDRLGPRAISESPTRPKPKPASPKPAFGSWGTPATPTQQVTSTNTNAGGPTGTGSHSGTRQVSAIKDGVLSNNPPIRPPSNVSVPAEPEIRGIQPQHPELQKQLDQILINYGLLLSNIYERARRVQLAFNAFKAAAAGGVPNDALPEPYRSMSMSKMRLALTEMIQATTELKSKRFILQQGLSELQRDRLRAEMKREEASRYLAARRNPQFMEKLVKPRGLGPEHTENRNRLRKAIQLQTERLNEIEEHVRRLKRKAELFKSGNMSYQPPNLEQVRNSCQNIDLYISATNQQIAGLVARIDALPNSSQNDEDPSWNALHQSRGHPMRLSSSFAAPQTSLSRTASMDIAPETIATTVEVFTGEVRMTQLRDVLVKSRAGKPAPLSKSGKQTLQETLEGSAQELPQDARIERSRRNPFAKFTKPVVLKDLVMAKPTISATQLQPQSMNVNSAPAKGSGIPPSFTPGAGSSQAPAVVAAQPTPTAPASSTTRVAPNVESTRRSAGAGAGGSSRTHTKAVPINRDRQNIVQDTSFSFGPPPAVASTLKKPDNFFSLTGKKP